MYRTHSSVVVHVLTCSILLSSWPRHAYAADASLCDPQILDATNDTFGYRFRGDRCEGKYRQPTAAVAPQNLTIISFACTANHAAWGPASKPTLSWPSVAGVVSIRMDTRPAVRLRYRLDAETDGAKGRFTWDGDTWHALSIESTEVAVVIKGIAQIGAAEFPGTLLQARLGTDNAVPDCPQGPTFTVRSDRLLTSLTLCATPLAATGSPTNISACKTVPGPLAANTGISANLGPLKSETGLLQVSLSGASSKVPSSAPRYYRIKVD